MPMFSLLITQQKGKRARAFREWHARAAEARAKGFAWEKRRGIPDVVDGAHGPDGLHHRVRVDDVWDRNLLINHVLLDS